MSPKPAKSTAKSTTRRKSPIELYPELRGRGPKKGAPNAGRPPSVLRDAYRQAASERLGFLLDVVDGKVPEATTADRLKAMDMLNKYGGMSSVEVTVAPKLVQVDV